MLFSRSRDAPSLLLHPQRMNEPIAEGNVIVMVGGVVVYVTDSEGEERIAPYRQTIQQIKTPGRNRGFFSPPDEHYFYWPPCPGFCPGCCC
jgi:hypothetical protein